MAQVVVRNLEEDVKARLKKRAQQNGWSMEEEIRQILSKAVTEPRKSRTRLGSRIAARFSGIGLEAELPELSGQAIDPMELGR